MVRRFWKVIAVLTSVTVVLTIASWAVLVTLKIPMVRSASITALLSLPTGAPSIWDVVLPAALPFWLVLVVFLIRTWFTGGFYGTLIRMNLRQAPNVFSFAADASRSLLRLLLWNLFWFLCSFLAVVASHQSHVLATTAAVFVFLLRGLFFLAEPALVSETRSTMRQAIQQSVRILVANTRFWLPFLVAAALLTGLALKVSALVPPPLLLAVACLYTVIETWLSHMVVSRYLYFSGWVSDEGQNTLQRESAPPAPVMGAESLR